MLRRWLRSRARSEPGLAMLRSSAVGLIHFPTLTMQPPTAPGAPGPYFGNFRLEPSAADAGRPAAVEGLVGEFQGGTFSRPRRIVVGVTHDQSARNALRWAYETATANDATLVVVTAFELPCPALTIYGWARIDRARCRRRRRIRAGKCAPRRTAIGEPTNARSSSDHPRGPGASSCGGGAVRRPPGHRPTNESATPPRLPFDQQELREPRRLPSGHRPKRCSCETRVGCSSRGRSRLSRRVSRSKHH